MSQTLDVLERVRVYLSHGGLFNPELMNHDNVRTLVMDLRAEVERLRAAQGKEAIACSISHDPSVTCEVCRPLPAPAPQGEQEPTPWTIDGSMPLPACRNDSISRADVMTMWNNWRQALPKDRPFFHSHGVDFLNRLNEIQSASAPLPAPTEMTKATLEKAAFESEARRTVDSREHTTAAPPERVSEGKGPR